MGIDATGKLPGEGPSHWPAELAVGQEIRDLVDRRWKEYGL
jgi:3-polyprenyl-4-hydroxybenzoate decarboxylase